MDSQAATKTCFRPCLLRVEASSDLLNPGDDLWVTSWWQNLGDMAAAEPLYGSMEMELGHQRVVESSDARYSRLRWEPYPAPQYWLPGDIWATTCRWHIPAVSSSHWGGTYKLYLGLCDGDNTPIRICGPGHKDLARAAIGEVDVGWGWGTPTMEKQRRTWSVDLNERAPSFARAETPGNCQAAMIGDQVKARLAAAGPLLLGIHDDEVGLDFAPSLPEVVLRRLEDDQLLCSFSLGNAVSYVATSTTAGQVSYKASVQLGTAAAAGFELRYAMAGRRLSISLENIEEEEGYELLQIRIPVLVSLSGRDAMLVDFFGDGRLLRLDAASPVGYLHHYDVRNAGVLYDSRAMLVLELPRVDDRMYAGVLQNQEGKSAGLGIALTARVRARGKLASIPVQAAPLAEVTLLDDSWGAPSWQAAARFLRQGLKPGKLELYRHVPIVRYHVTQGPQPEPGQVREDAPYGVTRLTQVHTFSKVTDAIRRIHNLTDGAPQVVYIGGWQYRGYDTGYPYVFETDPRVGTVEDLRRCIREGRQYNALVGMHDNYDDCYPSPHLDERVVAHDEEGKPWKGWFWAGGLSWILGLRKYVKWGFMPERVRRTVEMYGVNSTYHLDVLSSEPIRHDFDPACPAAGDASLEAKLAIIEEFNKYGIDITSETVTHPFVGRIGYAAGTRGRQGTLFPGERQIPLVQMVYHGLIRYDGGGEGKRGLLQGILLGSGSSWSEDPGWEHVALQAFYLKTLPMGFLADRAMLDYREDGPEVYVDYGNGSYVKANVEELTYEIAVAGRIFGRNWVTCVPGFKEGSYLAFSLQGGSLNWEAPQGWHDGMELRAVTLTGEGEGEKLSCAVSDGRLGLDMPPHTPARIMPRAVPVRDD